MIKAVIFDLNGVISDTQKWHSRVEAELLRRQGVKIFHQEVTRKYASVRAQDVFSSVLSESNISFNMSSLMKEKYFHVYDFFKNDFSAISGSVDLIKSLHSQGYSLAVASSSKLSYVRDVLNKIGVRAYFDFIVGGDMVENGKPHPESFLFAASTLEVDPEHCLVIEDGVAGVHAALSAGMKCVGLKGEVHVDFPTNLVVDSLSDITLDFIRSL